MGHYHEHHWVHVEEVIDVDAGSRSAGDAAAATVAAEQSVDKERIGHLTAALAEAQANIDSMSAQLQHAGTVVAWSAQGAAAAAAAAAEAERKRQDAETLRSEAEQRADRAIAAARAATAGAAAAPSQPTQQSSQELAAAAQARQAEDAADAAAAANKTPRAPPQQAPEIPSPTKLEEMGDSELRNLATAHGMSIGEKAKRWRSSAVDFLKKQLAVKNKADGADSAPPAKRSAPSGNGGGPAALSTAATVLALAMTAG
eukprot:gene6610-144_t